MNNLLLEMHQTLSQKMPREFRHALQAAIKKDVPEAVCSRILLCLSEAMTNLVEHARPAPSQVTIRFIRKSDGWYLNIFDDGESWDPTEHFDDNLLSLFSDEMESGRGVAIMHAQCEKISYRKGRQLDDDEKNHLRLFWALPRVEKKQSILIVEDNNSLRMLYKAYLMGKYEVITAINGFEALEKLSEHKVDLVLSDIRMPEMNGLSLRKKINQQTGSQLIPFVFLTGEDDEMIQDQAAELGIDDYLIKPVNKPQLMKVIQRILGRSKQVYQQLTTRIDKQITDSLKPTIPATSHGWRMQVASRDTGSGGGDLLLHQGFDSMFQLLLTDIMGHDDSAKFFSHAYGGFLHGLIQSMPPSQGPAYVLEQLSNTAISDKVLSKVTLTCCSMQLSESGKIAIASAGHPPPLLITANDVTPIDTSGIMPGLLEDCHYERCDLNLTTGQRIALFTDGLFDSADDNESRKQLEEQITDALISTLPLPIEQALNQVMMLFDQITAGKPTDDSLLLLLEPI